MCIQKIESKIFVVRGIKIMLDYDLATLYEVETKNLNLAVKRNTNRFPEDFMFRLTKEEWDALRLQFETSKGRGGTRYLPYAFTEQGIAMLSGILKSQKAVDVNISIMRTFVYMRKFSMSHKDLEDKIITMEKKYDKSFKIVFRALRKLIEQGAAPRNRIGFNTSTNE